MFTGKERDAETGLDYFGARYLSSATGRFTSPDPIVVTAARLADPQMFNLYVYTRNNPLGFVDPTGLEPYPAPCAGPTSGNCYSNLSEGEQKYQESIWERAKAMFLGLVAPGMDAHRNGYEPQIPTVSGPFPTDTEVSKQLADALANGTGVMADILDLLDPTGVGSAARSGLTGDSTGVALAVVGMGIPGGRSGGKIALSEAKQLVGGWSKGTFLELKDSLIYHFKTHGVEVGADSLWQYLRKAEAFSGNLRGAQRSLVDHGNTRYTKSGKFVILDNNRKIVSFGLEK